MTSDVFAIARRLRRQKDDEKEIRARDHAALLQKQSAFASRFHEYLLSLDGKDGVTAQLHAGTEQHAPYVWLKVGAINLGQSYTTFEASNCSVKYVVFGLCDFGGGVGVGHLLACAKLLATDLGNPAEEAKALGQFIEELAKLLVDYVEP